MKEDERPSLRENQVLSNRIAMKIEFTVFGKVGETAFSLGPFSAEARDQKEAALRVCAVQEAIECASTRPLGRTLIEVFCNEKGKDDEQPNRPDPL
jgi:hypothetical protein